MITCETVHLVSTSKIGTDMAGSLTSDAILVERLVSIAFQPVYTGSPVGSFNVEFSLDGSNWGQKATQAITTAGSWYMDFADPIATPRYVRILWVPTSGTGTLTSCNMTCKG